MPSVIPLIPVALDKPRQVRFDLASVAAAEHALTQFWGRDYTFFEAVQRILDFVTTADLGKLSLANLSILLWQGCRHEDPQLTLAQVHAAMPHVGDGASLIRLAGAVLEAWQVGSPPLEPTREGDSESHPLDGSSGPSSGPSLVSTLA